MSDQPLTKAEKLDIHAVPDGYVVYQLSHDRMHYLNATAALVFELCDGRHTEQDIVAEVGTAFQLDTPPADEVRSCLTSLMDQGLVRFATPSSPEP